MPGFGLHAATIDVIGKEKSEIGTVLRYPVPQSLEDAAIAIFRGDHLRLMTGGQRSLINDIDLRPPVMPAGTRKSGPQQDCLDNLLIAQSFGVQRTAGCIQQGPPSVVFVVPDRQLTPEVAEARRRYQVYPGLGRLLPQPQKGLGGPWMEGTAGFGELHNVGANATGELFGAKNQHLGSLRAAHAALS